MPQAKALGKARFLARQFKPLDLHRKCLCPPADFDRRPFNPFRQHIPDPFPQANFFNQPQDAVRVPPFQRQVGV